MTDGDFKSLGDFLSVGNDGLLIFWSLDSTDPKNIVNAHESFIYTVTSSKKFIATAGEDRIVKLWTLDSNGNSISCTQSIPIPASSIWSVKFDSEGINLFCASSDGYIYQFSNNLELQCGSDDQAYKEFNSRLNSMQLSSGQMNSQVSELDVLKNPGKKIGQVVTVNSEGGNISAYQWDGTIWCKIGDVVDDLTGSKKTLYNGKVYDYVFDVEFESSKTPLKLPCDRNENPYEVASKFISNNNLSPDLIHEIVDFLIKNIETKTIQVVDSNLFNPYLNSEASSNNKVEGSNIPLLKSVNYEGLIKKISEFNKIECGFNIDMKFLSSLKNSLEKNIPFADTQTMLQAIKKWDANRIFPLIDALRVIIVHKDTNIMECIKTIGDRFSEFSEIPSAVLTFSRLLINAIVDLEAFNYMMKTPNFFETVLDRCYSIPISDLDIPVLLVKRQVLFELFLN